MLVDEYHPWSEFLSRFFFLSQVGQSSTGSTFGSASSTYDDVLNSGNTGYTLSRCT